VGHRTFAAELGVYITTARRWMNDGAVATDAHGVPDGTYV
jgi:hypothetical protein